MAKLSKEAKERIIISIARKETGEEIIKAIESPASDLEKFKTDTAIAESLKKHIALATAVQNNDGGWDFSEDIDSENLRNTATASPANQFGTQPRVIVDACAILTDSLAIKAAKISFDNALSFVVHPSTNRMAIDRVMSLINAGKIKGSNPLAFVSYFNKGLEAFKAEIDFYKAIQIWHNDGNPANPNPPTAQITTIINTRPLEVDAVPMSQAARRLVNRLNFLRSATPNLVFYDAFYRIEVADALDGNTHDSENIRVFGLEIAEIILNENYESTEINFASFYCLQALAFAARIFNIFKNDQQIFLTKSAEAVDDIVNRIIPSGEYMGWYAITDGIDINDINTFIAGDKQDQGVAVLALVECERFNEAVALASKIIEIQSDSGQYLDIYDLNFGEIFYQEGAGNCALGIIKCIKTGIL